MNVTADVTMSHRDNDLDHDLNGAPTDAVSEPTLLETLRKLQQRTEQLEQTAATMRQVLEQMAERVANAPMVIYYINGERYAITLAEIDAIRRELIKPRSEETLYELALARQMAARHPFRSREEAAAELSRIIEASRADAIANGTALDDDAEAALDD
jgi:hypothetical protein